MSDPIDVTFNDGITVITSQWLQGVNDFTFDAAKKVVVSVTDKQFGAAGDGVTDDSAAIQAAITYVSSLGGGIVELPAGTYYKPATSVQIIPKSNVTLRGAGQGATILKHDDTTGTHRYLGSVSSGDACSNFAIENLTFEGMWSSSLNSNGLQISELWYITNLRITNVEVRKSRAMGITGWYCNGVSVTDCYVHETNGDGIAFWDSSDVRVIGNKLENCDDDAISLHTNDATSPPLRNRLVVLGNEITACNGIKVMGAKNCIISNNTLSRCYAYGIYVDFDPYFNQGNTPLHSIVISNNILNDVMARVQGGAGDKYYIRVGGGQRNAGSLAAAPGMNDTGTDSIVSLFGSNTGYFQAQNTDNTANASPGGYFLHIHHNILTRTLPAVSAISDWGFGSLWSGNQLSGSYTGAVAEADLNIDGIIFHSTIKHAIIESNIISTTGKKSIYFDVGSTPADRIFEDFTIRGNKFSDFSEYGIFWPGSSLSTQDIRIVGNDFDADPRFVNANRGANGTWQASTTPIGIYAALLSGTTIIQNEFKNLAICISEGGTAVNTKLHNIFKCNPSTIGFSTSNEGIGTVIRSGEQVKYIIEDGNPTSATFGKILSTTLFDSNTLPTTGKYVAGHVVHCTNPTVGGTAGSQYIITGWIRTTVGTGNVLNTDWRELRCLTGT